MPNANKANAGQKTGALWRQLVAMLYDALLIIALFFIAGFALVAIYGTGEDVGESNIPRALYQGVMVALLVLFYGTFWLKSGQTLGMQAWRIRLVNSEGGAVSAKQVLIRLAAAVLSWLPAGLGYWWSLWDRDRRTWHDRISGTHIARVPKNTTAGETAKAPPPTSKPQ
jgi:uncharacterized RDD family membrane protein YckC